MSLLAFAAAGGSARRTRAIEFVSEGAAFAPRIAVSPGASVLWTFADGSTSESVTPSVTYGTAGSRTNRLRVTDGDLLAVNLGYDGADGGSSSSVATTYATLHGEQNVSAVRYLESARDSLIWWSSRGNTALTELDFTDFTALQRVECYSGGLTACGTSGCTALRRLCLEGNEITGVLDLSDSPIEDIRGSYNSFTDIEWGDTSHLWHICIRRIPGLPADAFPPMSALPVIRDYFVQDTGRSGIVDLTNGFPAGRNGEVWLYDNAITGIVLTGCPGLRTLLANNNSMNQTAVDSVLSQLVALGASNGTINLEENTVPSAAGLADAATLTSRGCTVTVDT